MEISNPCFNPKIFTPSKKPLLSLSQWQMLQLYLVDAQNLRLTSAEMPYPDVLKIYLTLNSQAINFHGKVLPKAHSLGNKLFNYGQNASQTFGAVAQLMTDIKPNKDAIVELLDNLKTTALAYQNDSKEVFTAIDSYISQSNDDLKALDAAVLRETNKAGADKAKIIELQARYRSDFANKQAAQAKITSDQQIIKSTKYYSWFPFVGTAVAVGEIVAKENDIDTQLAIIQADIIDMQKLALQMENLQKEIGQLTYTANYNKHMAKEISNAMNGLTLIEGAWGTIVAELSDVIKNIGLASESTIKEQKCLASVFLTTAADEWQQVATDARIFANNFYLQPIKLATELARTGAC